MALSHRSEAKSEETWLRQIDPARIPPHLAVIMDGNGRWARRRRLPRTVGHARGAESTEQIIEACRLLPDRLAALGVAPRELVGEVRWLTLYTFSAENWSRPPEEVSLLMGLIERMLREKLEQLHRNQIQVRLLGRADGLPTGLRRALEESIEQTRENRSLTLFLALNYGGRSEIVDAARKLAAAVGRGELAADEIDESRFAASLYAPDVPDPDLLIRTGGDQRVSNFLLWQIAYSEFWITPTLWPAFRPVEIYQAIAEFQQRSRRFGGLNGQTTA